METQTVLLVSTDDAAARRAGAALKQAGFAVRRTRDAGDAAMMVLGASFAAVVLDRNLPDGGSTMLLRRLAANADLFWVPVVLIGDDDSLAQGAWATIQKPTRAGAVLRALEPVCHAYLV